MFVGPPATGKSTFAARLVDAGVVEVHDVLSTDALREELTGDASDTSRDRAVFARIRSALEERMRAGRTTVVDATGLWSRGRARHLAVARAFGRPTVAVRFATPLHDLLIRNQLRPRVVPAGVVVHMARQLEEASTEEQLRAEGFDVVVDARDVFRRTRGG